MEPPFINLWDVAGILMIVSGFAFVVWLLGGLPFRYVALIVILFFTAMFFAEQGSSK